MKEYVMSYYLANRWGSMVEKTTVLRGPRTLSEARLAADRQILRIQAKGTAVYPQYDLKEQAA